MSHALPAALMSHPAQILVVDDDSELRGQTADYLLEHGYGVHAAADAKEMDAILASQSVDLIILDVMLPGEGGLSICQRLARSAGVSIIMLSAMGEEVDRVLGLELGADDYLPKPCSPRELLARVRPCCAGATSAAPARRARPTTPIISSATPWTWCAASCAARAARWCC